MSYYNEYILVVEDDIKINYICYSLQTEGFNILLQAPVRR